MLCGWGWDGQRTGSWRCSGLCKEDADPRKTRSGDFQGLVLGKISVQQCQECLQHRKEEHVNEIHCWHGAGRHLTCVGDTFSSNGRGSPGRSCLQLGENGHFIAFIVGIVAGLVLSTSSAWLTADPGMCYLLLELLLFFFSPAWVLLMRGFVYHSINSPSPLCSQFGGRALRQNWRALRGVFVSVLPKPSPLSGTQS